MAKRKPAKKNLKSSLKKTVKNSEFMAAVGGRTKKLTKLRGRSTKNKAGMEPVWDLDRDGITYSSISKFLNCRRRFHLRMVEGWQPKGINFPLEFGNLFHLYLEAEERDIAESRLLRIGMNYAEDRIRDRSLDSQTATDLHRLVAVSFVTYQQYRRYWEKQPSMKLSNRNIFEKDFRWIEKEASFDVPWTLPNGRSVRLRGKRDGKFCIPKIGEGNWLFENKTKGDIDEVGIRSGLTRDMQTGLYLLTMSIDDHGAIPHGFIYNVIRRTRLKPRVNEAPADFAKRVDSDIAERPEFYFMRWVSRITKDDLLAFQTQILNPVLYQIVTWWDSIKKNPLDPWHTEDENGNVVDNMHHFERPFGCYDSMAHNQRGDYFEIITENNFYNFEKTHLAFPELDDASNDISRFL